VFNSGIRLAAAAAAVAAGRGGCDKERNGNDAGVRRCADDGGGFGSVKSEVDVVVDTGAKLSSIEG